MSAIKGVDCSIQKGDGYQQNPLEKSYFIVKITDPGSVRPSLKWLDTVFQGQYLPSLSINYLSNRKRFPCLRSLIQTREGLGEFETVMQSRDEVEGLHNCREFSQRLECLYQAMQTQEKVFYCFYKINFPRKNAKLFVWH